MFRAYSVPCSHDPALEERESILDGVRVNVAHDIDFAAVIDGFVLSSFDSGPLHGKRIGRKIVCENHIHIRADILTNELRKSSSLHVFGMEHSQITIPLANADDDFFVFQSGTCPASLVFSSDIGFVHLDFPIEHRLIQFIHRCPESVTEIPSGLVTDSERPLNLAGRYAILGLTEKVGCCEPLFEREMSIIENCSSQDGELIAA